MCVCERDREIERDRERERERDKRETRETDKRKRDKRKRVFTHDRYNAVSQSKVNVSRRREELQDKGASWGHMYTGLSYRVCSETRGLNRPGGKANGIKRSIEANCVP